MDRRFFLFALMAGTAGAGVLGAAPAALGKDGRDNDRDSSDDDNDDDNDGRDDKGDDDKDDDHDDDDDDDGHSGSGSEPDRSGSGRDHQRARDAVGRGEILPLREILKRVETSGGGRVIAVDLNLKASRPYYTLKVQSGSNVRTVKFDAESGRRLNLFGW
ncbi:PepSY domain-containing protein [Peteryoungia ipomoeae]|uniref:PepSY domain-containing protein n=1 Tax=Peteryoungia ipomoeae TaxID=1210932 RepID=UPI0019814298|nr:hypothetical protein [Peteryoungia ipomoeae]